MTIIWRPTGSLNVSTAATDLSQESDGRTTISGAFQRCKNVSLERRGRVGPRLGTTQVGSSLNSLPNLLIEMAGERFAFAGGEIYKDEALLGSNFTDAQWSGIKYNSFNDTTNQIFALNGTDLKRITTTAINEWGIEAPSAAPTLGVGSGTGLTGTYNVKYTYARLSGSTVIAESNPSDAASSGQALSNEDLAVTWSASSDPQVTHVRLYRTLPGGSEYFFDQNVAIGTTTIDTSTADASLGGLVATNHDRPPAGSLVAGPFYNGVCFIAKENLLYYCLAKQPEYWPTTNFIEVGAPQFPIKAIVELSGRVYCLTKSQIWLIQGTGSGGFLPVPMRSLAGAPNQYGAVAVEGYGIYHIGSDGIYLFSGSRDTKITQEAFDVLFTDATSTNGMDPVLNKSVGTWLIQFENKLYFHYAGGNLIVFNLDTGKALYHKYGYSLTAPTVDKTNDRFYVGDYNNAVRRLEDPNATNDDGTAISWEIESKDFTLQTRSHFPRWAKWDVDGTATGAVLLNGVVHQTHALSVSRSTKRRLIKPGNGERVSIRISGSAAGAVYGVEFE